MPEYHTRIHKVSLNHLRKILLDHGVNMVRQRVWAVDGDYGLQYNLQLAQRAYNAGLMFGLNLYSSDTWTNAQMQSILSGRPDDIDGLTAQLYSYALGVCNTFADASLFAETITIGNEISAGMLWPTGNYDQPKNLSLLLKTASSAIKASKLSPQPKVQFHLNAGQQKDLQQWFYDLVLNAGPLTVDDFDMQGVSFYPVWGEDATMANLNASLSNMATGYSKEVIMTAYSTYWSGDRSSLLKPNHSHNQSKHNKRTPVPRRYTWRSPVRTTK